VDRLEENFHADENPGAGGRKLPGSQEGEPPGSQEESIQPDGKPGSRNNRESKKETNRERIEDSKPSKDPPTDSEPIRSEWVEVTIDTCTRDFDDLRHLSSNVARAHNLWLRTDLSEEEFIDKIQEARRVTKERISLSVIRERGKRMPYFFAVLEDRLGLREEVAQS
jgi:hypothetical protein